MIVGTALMGLGFVGALLMLSGLVVAERPPSWIWGMLLWIGAGAAVLVSAFFAAARDRRDRTRALFERDRGTAADR
jgi:cytochrome c-type biogenesis protein CcmH/NrfF